MVKYGNTLESSRKDGRLANTDNIYDKRTGEMQEAINQKIANVHPADEEDLTKTIDEEGRSVTKFADRSYSPSTFSGKGYKILRKNIQKVSLAVVNISVNSTPSSDGYVAFIINGIETHVDLLASTDNTTALVADKIAAKLAETMTEYEVSQNDSSITLTRKFGGTVSTSSSFSANSTGASCTISDTTKSEHRCLITSVMVNNPNTIYEIRYDFNLNGETIEIPEGCTLKFEGGSLKNGSVKGNNTTIIEKKQSVIFKEVIFLGVWTNKIGYLDWFEYQSQKYQDKLITNMISAFKDVCISKTYKTYGTIHLLDNTHLFGGGKIINTHAQSILHIENKSNILVENLYFEQTDNIRSFALFYLASNNVTIKNCHCYNCGIIGSDGEYKNKLTYSNKVIVTNNVCENKELNFSEPFTNTDKMPTGVFLAFTDEFRVEFNNISNVFQAITNWGGDAYSYNWYDVQNDTPIFGSNNGIISHNIIKYCAGSSIFVALSRNITIEHNYSYKVENEIYDAEGSKDIFFKNNTGISNNVCLTVFGWRDNIVFDGNDIEVQIDGMKYWVYVDPWIDGKFYKESLSTLGTIKIINNKVIPIDRKSTIEMHLANGDVELSDNYILNSYGSYLYPNYTFIAKGNTFVYNSNANVSANRITSKNIYDNNQFILYEGVFINGLICPAFSKDLDETAIVKFTNNFIKAKSGLIDVFHTYSTDNGVVNILFENNILSKEIRDIEFNGINFIDGNPSKKAVNVKMLYRHNVWEDNFEDLYSNPKTSFWKSIVHNMFAKYTVISFNIKQEEKIPRELRFFNDGYYEKAIKTFSFGTDINFSTHADSGNRPILTSEEEGFEFYDTTLKKKILWNGSSWVNIDGSVLE